jgi:signal transduction histidine kinase/DNA-binding NarL/FixJ family response regulator
VRLQLVGAVFLLVTPAALLLYVFHLPMAEFAVGVLSLVAAWLGGEVFVRRQVRSLIATTRSLREGNLDARTGLESEPGELGELARGLDDMAGHLAERDRERELAQRVLMIRANQQTGAAALGQLAMTATDFPTLLQQAVAIVANSIEVEFSDVMAMERNGSRLSLCSGHGWTLTNKSDTRFLVSPVSLSGYVLTRNEPAIIVDWNQERRFQKPALLEEHQVRSSACVPIRGRNRTFGLLTVHSTKPRPFSGEDVQFLLTCANHLATAGDRLQSEVEIQKLASFAQSNPNAAMELTPDGTITYCNEAALRLALSVGVDHPNLLLPPNILEVLRAALTATRSASLETQLAGHTLFWTFTAIPKIKRVHCYVEDITERTSLAQQLRQSQKMDSLGHLAAGVAHDFNNMLTVIQGHSSMLMARLSHSPHLRESAQCVHFAAERAAALTKQLLLFSRKSVIQPKLVDLSEVVGNLAMMLRRLLGEHIKLEFNACGHLPMVRCDGGMIEQTVMNLAVNARDAMPKGGTLSIQISKVAVTPNYVLSHPDARAGEFVCLRVSDTGEGMSEDTRSRIFEPFFTTKEVGKGTGLGLATVFGIVRQHEGWIEVDSQLGHGSTFTIYLPASDVISHPREQTDDPPHELRTGAGNILLVEDESALREMAALILQECGYSVVKAANGREAIEQWKRHGEEIDLVVTDMVMPEGLTGAQLADQLISERPNLKMLLTSGYSPEDVGAELQRHPNTRFLEKPYTRLTLAHAVRELLDAPVVASEARPSAPAAQPEEPQDWDSADEDYFTELTSGVNP